MDWEVAKFAIEAVVAGVGGYVGVRTAVARLEIQVKYLEKGRDEDRLEFRKLQGTVYEHGDRIAVIESKAGINYRGG